jgi:hypothetical protein
LNLCAIITVDNLENNGRTGKSAYTRKKKADTNFSCKNKRDRMGVTKSSSSGVMKFSIQPTISIIDGLWIKYITEYELGG